MIKKITFIITSKTEYDLLGYVKETGTNVNVPKCTIKGFNFLESCIDEDGFPRIGIDLPAVQKDNGTVYLDRSSKILWNYSPKSIDSSDSQWLPLIKQILSLNLINKLTKQTCDELLKLYDEKRFYEMRMRIIEECGLYKYVFEEESQFHENKSSLVHPANASADVPIEIQRSQQLDELSQTIVGALNAQKDNDFHLIVGISDDGVLNDNVREELETYYDNNPKTFIDMFINRMQQLVTSSDCLTSIELNFVEIKDKLILDIVVPKWTGKVICFRDEVFLRIQSSTHKLSGHQVVEFMENRKINNL